MVERAASVGCILTMDSTEKVQLDSMLGHSILELVKELTATGQTQVLLVKLNTW